MASVFLSKELREIGLFTIFVGLMGWLVPILALTLGRGLEAQENFQKVVFYGSVGTTFFVAIVVMKLVRLFSKSIVIDGIIHDPEESILGKVASFRNQFIGGVLVFSIAGIFAVVQNTFLTGVIVQQQIAETATLALAVEPAVMTETMIILFLVSVLVVLLNVLVARGVINKPTKEAFKLGVIPFVIMMFWIAFHSFRYSSSEVNILGVALFGLVSGFLIVTFNSFLMAYLLHAANNLFQASNGLFSDAGITTFTVIFLVLFFATYGLITLRGTNRAIT